MLKQRLQFEVYYKLSISFVSRLFPKSVHFVKPKTKGTIVRQHPVKK